MDDSNYGHSQNYDGHGCARYSADEAVKMGLTLHCPNKTTGVVAFFCEDESCWIEFEQYLPIAYHASLDASYIGLRSFGGWLLAIAQAVDEVEAMAVPLQELQDLVDQHTMEFWGQAVTP